MIKNKTFSLLLLFFLINSFSQIAGEINFKSDEVKPMGLLIPHHEAVMPSRINSKVKEINVEEGDKVKKGEKAVILDKTQFKLRKNVLQSNLKELTTTLKHLNEELKRSRKLYSKKVVSEAKYDKAKHRRDRIKEEIQSVKNEINLLNFDIQNTVIEIPFTGEISQIIVHKHEYIQEGEPIFEIIKTDSLKLIVNFKEKLINKIQRGHVIKFSPVYNQKNYAALVKHIAPQIDPETKTFTVTAIVNNKSGNLSPGMFVNCYKIVKDKKSR